MTAKPEELREIAEQALAQSAEREGLLPFLQRYVKPEGREWTLEGHEYLRALAEDPARHIVVEKAAQMGLSTLFIGELLQVCLAGHRAGYFLDTKAAMSEFVQARIDPIIDADDELMHQVVEERFEPDRPRRRGKGVDNIRQKKIGRGLAYFLGVNNRGDVRTRALDAVYLDEVSELDPDLVDFVDDRMLHSTLRLRREISQPRIPEMDIDEAFQLSDMKYWQIRCRRCRTWSALELSFPACLVQVKGEWRIACPRCHARVYRKNGEWVALHPGRDISGYHLSQLYGAYCTAEMIAQKWALAQTRPSRMENFMVSYLGLPFAGDRQPMPPGFTQGYCGDWTMSLDGKGANLPAGIAFAGIDVGDMCHLVIARYAQEGERRVGRIVLLEQTNRWELLLQRLQQHEVKMVVVDAMPYKPDAKRLCRAFGPAAIIYSNAMATHYGIEDGETEPVHTIKVDRTEYMDAVSDAFRAGELWLPRASMTEVALARDQLGRFVKDKRADGSFAYRRSVDNHYGMAIANMLMAVTGQQALHLAPAGHFHGGMTGERSRHIVGDNLAPRRW